MSNVSSRIAAANAIATITGTVPCRTCGLLVSAGDPSVGSWSAEGDRLVSASHRRNAFGEPLHCLRAMGDQITSLTARLDEMAALQGNP